MTTFTESPFFLEAQTPVSAEVAANECGNCGRACDHALQFVDEYELHMCETCYDEARAILATEAASAVAAAFAIAPPRRHACVHCQTTPARWDSLYCSESCRREFLTFPEAA